MYLLTRKLKLELYETVITWLTITAGAVTNVKTLSVWINAIGYDTRVEKDKVELKMVTKPKLGKSVKVVKNNSTSLSINPATTAVNTNPTYVQKNFEVCKLALKTLCYLLPVIDTENHRVRSIKKTCIFCFPGYCMIRQFDVSKYDV